jgi:hypothetical protein
LDFIDPGQVSAFSSVRDKLEITINARFAFLSKDGFVLVNNINQDKKDMTITLKSEI